MSNPTGLTIEQVVLGVTDDGRQFLRFDTNDEDGTSMYAWDLSDVANWLSSNYVSADVEVADEREDFDDDEPDDDPMWADSDALASAGWGTDEDYGAY